MENVSGEDVSGVGLEDLYAEKVSTGSDSDNLEEKYPRFNENKIKGRRTRLLSLLKRPDACFYYRVLTPQEQLVRQFGWECRYLPIDPLPNDHSMGIPPTIDEGDDKVSLRNLLDCHGENLEWADVIVMQRPTCSHHLELMRYIQKEMKKPVVWEGDDNYLDVPLHNNGHKYFEPRSEYIKNMVAEADLLTVTTEGLAGLYWPLRRKKGRESIRVCPNSINFETLDDAPTDMKKVEFESKRKWFMAMKQMVLGKNETEKYKEQIRRAISIELQKQKIAINDDHISTFYQSNKDLRFVVPDEDYAAEVNGKKMVGWGGSPTHELDLATVTNPLMKIMNEDHDLQLGMVGYIHRSWMDKMRREQLWQFGLVPVKNYYSLYKQVGMTVGIAPVNQDTFNIGKSNLKVIEYMALGIYAIATDYITYAGTPIKHYEESGFEVPSDALRGTCGPHVPLCKNDEEWEREIKKGLNDEDLRFEITQKNREYVEEHYNIYENVKYWKDAYESLL